MEGLEVTLFAKVFVLLAFILLTAHAAVLGAIIGKMSSIRENQGVIQLGFYVVDVLCQRGSWKWAGVPALCATFSLLSFFLSKW